MAAAAMVALPDDLLAGLLGLLPARTLAASRAVCKAWRDLIDEHQLLLQLRRHLPHSVRGLFINNEESGSLHFFSRPTSSSSGHHKVHSNFDFIKAEQNGSSHKIMDHCNGLVLYLKGKGYMYGRVLHVCNPTTRWLARLPQLPGGIALCKSAYTLRLGHRAFLVFDPFVSPEYKVLLSPAPHRHESTGWVVKKDEACYLMEWPPSLWKSWYEFSSSTGRWEEKAFVREGEAAVTVGDLFQLNKVQRRRSKPHWQYGAYWQGALYIHCRGACVLRFSLLDGTYSVIKLPIQLADSGSLVPSFLGRSEKGVYIAATANHDLANLRVWTLRESGDQMEWVPKNQRNHKINTHTWWMHEKKIDKMKYRILDLDDNRMKNHEVSLEQNICWNSDDDNIIDYSDDEEEGRQYIKFLGFHPYKEVIFLYKACHAVALHLNSAKVQYLGSLNLPDTHLSQHESFVYMPCLIGD